MISKVYIERTTNLRLDEGSRSAMRHASAMYGRLGSGTSRITFGDGMSPTFAPFFANQCFFLWTTFCDLFEIVCSGAGAKSLIKSDYSPP